ncbi:MAG: Coenzyme biosynthesis bifunctional protein CoaBC [Pseudomonadota bacterium]|jgi:phosphopantothenoylcysteine decarboxylase/phosphopantothenate--cysteine ligase
MTNNSGELQGKHIVLGLSGGIAAYKAAELCRAMVKEGATVQVVMTEAAEHFMTKVTMQALSGRQVFGSQWDDTPANGISNNMPHINLTRGADAIVIAPCSADFMAKLLHGRADELLSLMCLARQTDKAPLILAPAMNREMWANPATQRNVAQLKQDGITVLDVGEGDQACGEVGDGRMLEADEILADLVAFFTPKSLLGQKVLITAGPTYEAIDPVRGITNLSSGKMGFAIARAAFEAGADVTLIAGPVSLSTPRGVKRIDVKSAQDMLLVSVKYADYATIFIASAAVADWRPANPADQKLKKDGSGSVPQLSFVENPDILATIAQSERGKKGLSGMPDGLFCVGFAAESQDLLANAQAKRIRKGVPLLVGNIGPATFGQDDNALLLVDAKTVKELPEHGKKASKRRLAQQLVADVAARVGRPA